MYTIIICIQYIFLFDLFKSQSIGSLNHRWIETVFLKMSENQCRVWAKNNNV